MLAIPIGRRVTAVLAVGALCLLLATAAAAIPGTDDRASTTAVEAASDRTSPDRALAYAAQGETEEETPTSTQRTATPAGSVQSQLFGVAFALAVLAVIGAAAWGARTAVADRFGTTERWGGDRTPGAEDGPVEVEPLTDEERIVALLEENGGRLKQGDVVETTEWSKAKVSRLLSSMEDDDTIVRIQLGREKLIFLSGQEPSGARSTLRDDH